MAINPVFTNCYFGEVIKGLSDWVFSFANGDNTRF